MAYLMGIDIGSTNLKAAIYDDAGNAIGVGSHPNEVCRPDVLHPQWAFWDPEKIWSGIADAIKQAVGKITDSRLIKGVSVTGMGMDGAPIDQNGNWLYPFISWHCNRTEPISRRWQTDIGAKKTFLVSGKQIFPFDTVFRLIWMKENQPEILARTEKWLLIEDFINFMLCGSKSTDYSMATTTQLLDQKKRNWSDEILQCAAIDKKILPDLLPSGSKIGTVTKKSAALTGLAEGTPVILGGHDYHCAALAVGAFEPGVMMDITGTWEMLLCSANELNLTEELFDAGLSMESHVAKDTYSIAAMCVSGEMVEWFRRKMYAGQYGKLQDDLFDTKKEWDDLLQEIANVPPGSNGIFFLPHFTGCSCPVMDPYSRGAFLGLNPTVGQQDMLHAVIEGLNYQLKDMVNSIEIPLHFKTGKIVATGGATNNDFWIQNKADITGKMIEVSETPEATCLGAAMLAGIGTGVYQNEKEAFQAVCQKPKKIFEPDYVLNQQYEEYFGIYQRIYPALKTIHEDISKRMRG